MAPSPPKPYGIKGWWVHLVGTPSCFLGVLGGPLWFTPKGSRVSSVSCVSVKVKVMRAGYIPGCIRERVRVPPSRTPHAPVTGNSQYRANPSLKDPEKPVDVSLWGVAQRSLAQLFKHVLRALFPKTTYGRRLRSVVVGVFGVWRVDTRAIQKSCLA